MSTLRLHWEIARLGFRRWSTYRAATVAGIFTNTVFGFVKASVLIAVFRHHTDVGGFDVTDAVTFTFVSQGFIMVVAVFNWQEVALRVRTGDVATDLCRPVDYELWWLAQDLGRALYHALARGIAPYVAGALVFDLAVSTHPIDWVAFLFCTLMAVVISFGIRFLTNLSSFWIIDARGPIQIVMVVWLFFSGFTVPLNFFPEWLGTIARLTPFAAVVQLPIEVLLGKHHGLDLVGVIVDQILWAAVLLWCAQVALRRATRKVVLQGG
jgi:viologen exporter family transport system permease protein